MSRWSMLTTLQISALRSDLLAMYVYRLTGDIDICSLQTYYIFYLCLLTNRLWQLPVDMFWPVITKERVRKFRLLRRSQRPELEHWRFLHTVNIHAYISYLQLFHHRGTTFKIYQTLKQILIVLSYMLGIKSWKFSLF